MLLMSDEEMHRYFGNMTQAELVHAINQLSDVAYWNESDRPGADSNMANAALYALMIARQYDHP